MRSNFSIKQYEILLDLYKLPFSNFDSLENLYSNLTKAIVTGLDISRASIWYIDNDKLICKSICDSEDNLYYDHLELLETDFKIFFGTLQNNVSGIVDNAEENILTNIITDRCHFPLNIKKSYNFPINLKDKLIGIICCEDDDEIIWSENDISFAESIVDVLRQIIDGNNRKISEKSLLENQDRFKFISENISDGIYIIENEALVFASSVYLDMLGLSEEEKRESYNIDMFNLTHPDDAQRIKDIIYGAASKKIPAIKYVFRCRKRNGEYMWREDIMNIHYNESGHAFRAVTITRNITQEKLQELEIVSKQKAIDLQNKLLIKLYETTADISIKDKITYITTIASEGLSIDRASYWEIEDKQLVCKNLFDKIESTRSDSQKLNIRDLPKYIGAMKTQTAIIVDDVLTNEITSELVETYLKPLKISDLLHISIWENGKLLGILCCEHRENPKIWNENDVAFAKSLADFLSLALEEDKRKTIEHSLMLNQEKLKFISDNTSDGIAVFEKSRITYISPSYIRLSGYSEEYLLGLNISEIFNLLHPNDIEKLKNIVYTNLAKRVELFSYDYRFRGADGLYYWREDSANVIYDDTNLLYTKVIIISRDITERKKIDEKLIESEQQLRLITENTSDGVLVIEKGKLSYISPSYSSLLGYSLDDYVDFTIENILSKFHPDDLIRIKPLIFKSISNQVKELKYEHRFRGVNGKYYWREDSANIIYDENGKYSKYIVITRDISARKEAEKEKARLYEITEKQNEKLINFTHIVSHDIRSHTSNLSMILELFEDTKNPEEQKEYFNMLKQSTVKLSDTIFYLNETVAVQSGEKNEIIKLNLKTEIEKAILGITAIVKTNEAIINIEIEEEIEISATQSYLESIIFNILTNAIKYKSPLRKPVINITILRIEDYIKISIEDNGIGIDLEKNKDKIFGMYKTFHGNPDAVGLGLFMVKNHIESMGGKIEVESKINIGTTFNLYFI